jgi:hypothetical protein
MKARLPKEWEMDSAPHYFLTQYSANASIAEKISEYMDEYEKTCSYAKLKMYFNIYTLLNPEAASKK